MIRSILIGLSLMGFLIFGSPLLLWERHLGKKDPERKRKSSLKICQGMLRWFLWLSRAKVTVNGRDNIPDDQPVLYVGNHRSFFDIVIGYILVKGSCGFIAKAELKKVPFMANWMYNVDCVLMNRDSMKDSLKAILEAIDKIKSGVSIWIFPEGTRSKEPGVQMLPFKDGSFKIAEKTGCPVIPVAMTHTADIFENHFPFIRTAHVTVTFGKPLSMNGLTKEEKKAFPEQVHQLIQEMLEAQV